MGTHLLYDYRREIKGKEKNKGQFIDKIIILETELIAGVLFTSGQQAELMVVRSVYHVV